MSYRIQFIVFFLVILKLIQIHCEEIEININVKLRDVGQSLNTSSSKIISILIKHERNNLSVISANGTETIPAIVTSIPLNFSTTSVGTTSPYNFSHTWSSNLTDESFNTTELPWQTDSQDLLPINGTTEFPFWETNTTDSLLINDTTEIPWQINATDIWPIEDTTAFPSLESNTTNEWFTNEPYPTADESIDNTNSTNSWFLDCWHQILNMTSLTENNTFAENF